MDFLELYNQIAKEHGVSPEEVRKEIQEAITAAWKHPPRDGGTTRNRQAQVPCRDEIPTPEEMICYAVLAILKNRNRP